MELIANELCEKILKRIDELEKGYAEAVSVDEDKPGPKDPSSGYHSDSDSLSSYDSDDSSEQPSKRAKPSPKGGAHSGEEGWVTMVTRSQTAQNQVEDQQPAEEVAAAPAPAQGAPAPRGGEEGHQEQAAATGGDNGSGSESQASEDAEVVLPQTAVAERNITLTSTQFQQLLQAMQRARSPQDDTMPDFKLTYKSRTLFGRRYGMAALQEAAGFLHECEGSVMSVAQADGSRLSLRRKHAPYEGWKTSEDGVHHGAEKGSAIDHQQFS